MTTTGTVEDVSLREGIGSEAVMGMVRRHIQTEVDWESIEKLGQIGWDEISYQSGHKDFVTIVSAGIDGRVQLTQVLKERLKDTVKDFLEMMTEDLKKMVESGGEDMYDGFINAAKEVFGKRTRIVVDRFQVAKQYRKGFDSLRIKELKWLKEELTFDSYAELKGAMWVLRNKKKDLSVENQALLKLLFGYSPFVARHSVKFVEGFNHKIKVIKRRCYGILNIGHLFQRIFLDISDLEIYAI